jgi:hypothetical protein
MSSVNVFVFLRLSRKRSTVNSLKNGLHLNHTQNKTKIPVHRTQKRDSVSLEYLLKYSVFDTM